MSVICRTFVQNAWRSDLCSNCFKSLEEHGRRNNACEKLATPRYVPQAPSLYQSRGISTSLKWRLNESLYDRVSRRDIASQTARPPPPRHPADKKYKSVDFAAEEALVIGYGGNDYDSDTSPWEMGSDDGSVDLDLLDDTDEDRKMTRLTRNNTEFNSFNKNLLREEEEQKLNSILTHNDIQTQKKLNHYFFPSSTEIKSFLKAVPKVQNCKRDDAFNDDFTPLNTSTYSFVSELSKNMEQSSDSDYSTYRHTAGDSTDSESCHDAKYALQSQQLDTGSSTSGDISNFSDDSDTHECAADSRPYELRNGTISDGKDVRTEVQSKNEEHQKDCVSSEKREEGSVQKSAEVEDKQRCPEMSNEKEKQCTIESQAQVESSSAPGDHSARKEKEMVSNSTSMPNVKAPEMKRSPESPATSNDSTQDHDPSSSEREAKGSGKISSESDLPDGEVEDGDVIHDRQSKLAALALELELARRDSEAKNGTSPAPAEVKVKPTGQSPPSDKKASATLPDVLPAKHKKTKFSLRKLLKRNKDSATYNPKAWKKQTFDRNRLSLEIVHPMDLTEQLKPTPFVSSRARSLSALPQLSGDDQSGCALLECRKMDTVPARKAGTVAERKKNRPSLVRTPSCSALPTRPSERAPPPKPPPPPKSKAMHPPPPPPPPHSHPRVVKTNSNNASSPARPPPPKVPESKSRSHSVGSSPQELHSDKEYANLGDIRSLLTPKKPERPSAFSAPARDGEKGANQEDIYETLPAEEEEEDHYTYLDERQVQPCGRPWLDLQTSYAALAAANYEALAEIVTSTLNEGTEYLKTSLKWKDFVLEKEDPYSVRDKAVYSALCRNEAQDKVTLVVSPRKPTHPQNVRHQTRYPVLANFNDHVPKNSIGSDNYVLQDSEMASIYVLQNSKVTTVDDFAKASSRDVSNQYVHLRNYCFVLLQMIHTLKSLQAEGIEEINYDLQMLALVVADEDKPPVLVLFPEDKRDLTQSGRKTLCQATLETMLYFLQIVSVDDLKKCVVNGELLPDPVAHTFEVIAKVLAEEKASSLSQAKAFLEYMLWGPVDVHNDSHTTLQRWLDLQRAQMLKSTISTLQNRKKWHPVFEEYHLIFLLQASVKSLKNVISKL